MMLLLLLVVCGVVWLTQQLLSGRAHAAVTPSPARQREQISDRQTDLATNGWTALDDHQLNRLLDEFSP